VRFAFCPSSAVLTPPLLLCYALCGAVFVASVSLNTVLPFHLIDRGGSRTQIGLLFSLTTIVSMVLRPAVGSWIDRVGTRPVLLLGSAIFAAVSLTLHVPRDPLCQHE
jgi:MFS family permease